MFNFESVKKVALVDFVLLLIVAVLAAGFYFGDGKPFLQSLAISLRIGVFFGLFAVFIIIGVAANEATRMNPYGKGSGIAEGAGVGGSHVQVAPRLNATNRLTRALRKPVVVRFFTIVASYMVSLAIFLLIAVILDIYFV